MGYRMLQKRWIVLSQHCAISQFYDEGAKFAFFENLSFNLNKKANRIVKISGDRWGRR